MSRHRIVAREPVMQESHWEYQNGQVEQVYKEDNGHPDVPKEMFSYRCACGETFDEWDESLEHLNEHG